MKDEVKPADAAVSEIQKARKTELWKRFASTGLIADYLAYSRFDGSEERDGIRN